MVNSNLNIQRFPFFDSVKKPVTSDGISSPYLNNGYDVMTLEIISANTPAATKIIVEGCINGLDKNGNPLKDSECQWTEQVAIDMSTYKKISTVTNKGIYAYSIAGLSRVRVKLVGVTGAMTVVGAMEK